MLVRVYTCQNATLLEITCHGAYGERIEEYELCVSPHPGT